MYLAKLIVEEHAVIYVSGRAKLMPNSVEKAFNYILKGLVEDPDEYIKTMKKDRRYQQEVW